MSKMNSKDTTTMDRLKYFFRKINKGQANFRPREDYILPSEIEREICPDTSMSHRMRALKELSEIVLNHRLEENAVGRLWGCTQDLLQDNVAREHRHQAFQFFRCLIQGQYERLGIMRVHFFMVVKNHENHEDTGDRLDLLISLTENGRDILNMEKEIPIFLFEWMQDITKAGRDQDFLNMLVNIIKYNAAYVDEAIISGLVNNICILACRSNSQVVVLACLQVLDTIVCYSNLPSESLSTFIGALCCTVNFEVYCPTSWKIMRNLLGTHLGHSTLYTMCRMLHSAEENSDMNLLRGAVFYINMGLWGDKRVTTLKCTHMSVLPSLNSALRCKHPLVMYEVMLSVQRLVHKYGFQMHEPAWDMVLTIIETIIQNVESTTTRTPVTVMVTNHLHDTLCTIEQLIELGQFNGSVRRVFHIIERCSPVRPETSVLRLVSYLSGSIAPTQHGWLTKLNCLMQRYFKEETRTNIRIKVLDILSFVLQNNRPTYEDELITSVVLPQLAHLDQETDVSVRNSAAVLLVDLCLESETTHCLALMEILEKLLVRPFDKHESNSPGLTEVEAADVKTVIHGVIKILTTSMHTLPSTHAVKAYKMLVQYIEMHYSNPIVFDQVSSIRIMIFECFLHFKVDSMFRLGYPLPTGVRYSPYIVVEHWNCPPSPPPPPSSPVDQNSYHSPGITYLSLSSACRAIVTCLKQEQDWTVMLPVLKEITQVMKNKALILSRQDNYIDNLASALCSMVSDKSLCLPDLLRNTPPKFTRTDFNVYIFPVLSSLASCHAILEPSLQQRLIKCLECGLMSRTARQCVLGLTTCTLEMRDAMVKLLPEVLLNLSKISATVVIAIPILEFLSTLTRLPKVFANFVGDQYMSVFAISLPYTNPFKYNHYTVSLAHHVIAMWFLRCRLKFRRDLVKYIITGLRANVVLPFEEGQGQMMKTELVNEDSSNRKRSSSLTEQTNRRRERPMASRLENRAALDLKPPIDDALMAFHRELTETCMDLMARYTFSTCSALPKRQPTAQFLLNEGQSMTWLLGNKLITVTTSGCSQKPLKNGLCDKCWSLCRLEKDPLSPSLDTNELDAKTQTLQKTSLSRSLSNEIPQLQHKSNTSTAANSPSDEVRRSIDGGIQEADPLRLDQLIFGNTKQERQLCACWCQGWAEIYVRRPTGDMSWVMRLQNEPQVLQSGTQPPVSEIATLYLPSLTARKFSSSECDLEIRGIDRPISDPVSIPCSPVRPSPSRHSSKDSVDTVGDDDRDSVEENSGRSRNPVRRSNSSPEMSASWKNPFMVQSSGSREDNQGISAEASSAESKKKQTYSKDLRVNCEAIPEEMGTTPPTAEQMLVSQPSLLLAQERVKSAPATVQDGQGFTYTDAIDSKTGVVESKSMTVVEDTNKKILEQSSLSLENIKLLRSDSGSKEDERSSSGPPSINQSPVSLTNPKPAALLTTKPPLSPPPSQLSPRLQPKLSKEQDYKPDPSALPPLLFKRDRVHTISVMSPARKPREWERDNKFRNPRAKEPPKSGVSPSFVFLQLYHSAHFGHTTEKPLALSNSQMVQRAMKNLDRIPPYETHKVGVIYVGPGQANSESDILHNQYGSLRYAEFLQRLGTLIRLSDADPQSVFLGGLDSNGNDGKYAYIWQDDVIQVTFHVATLMPSKDTDPNCNNKKLHIGNDYVTIVYNESGEQYNIRTVKCQFNYACVIVEPLEHGSNQVMVKAREELVEHIGHSEPKIVSDQNVALLARQLALHANLASMVSCSLNTEGKDPYTSNWLERLRQIKRVRNKVLQEASSENTSDTPKYNTGRRVPMDDFTEYT